MTTYTIATHLELLIACVPDGTDLEPYVHNMQFHLNITIPREELKIETGLTLTDDEPSDEEFPAWDTTWGDNGGAQLEDERGKVWAYAVRQPGATTA